MSSLLQNIVRPSLEGFVNPEDSASTKRGYTDMVAVIIAFALALIILSFVGKLLWNGVIVELFTCVRPAKSVLQILGLFVFLSLLF
jgi:hypothetical protein